MECIRNREKVMVWDLFLGSWGARKGAWANGKQIAKSMNDKVLIRCLMEMNQFRPISAMGDRNVRSIIRTELRKRNWSSDFVFDPDYRTQEKLLNESV